MLLFLIFIVGTPLLSANHAYPHHRDDAQVIATMLYQKHDPIIVDGDKDFVLNGFTGSGTAEDPYIINGLNITNPGTSIAIMNTAAHFILKDCYVKATYSNHGIILQNVTFRSIEGCKATTCHAGIYLIKR